MVRKSRPRACPSVYYRPRNTYDSSESEDELKDASFHDSSPETENEIDTTDHGKFNTNSATFTLTPARFQVDLSQPTRSSMTSSFVENSQILERTTASRDPSADTKVMVVDPYDSRSIGEKNSVEKSPEIPSLIPLYSYELFEPSQPLNHEICQTPVIEAQKYSSLNEEVIKNGNYSEEIQDAVSTDLNESSTTDDEDESGSVIFAAESDSDDDVLERSAVGSAEVDSEVHSTSENPTMGTDDGSTETVILPNQCGVGLRRDCPNRSTCMFHHIDEIVGETVSKYARRYQIQSETTSNCVQCPHCIKSFKTKRGLKTHVTRIHPGMKQTPECFNQATSASDQHHTSDESNADFLWGDFTYSVFSDNLDHVYEKIVFMRQNLFKVPSGAAGKKYIREITRLISSWNTNSNLKDIAWKCVMVMPALLLQKPSSKSKAKEHKEALQRRRKKVTSYNC